MASYNGFSKDNVALVGSRDIGVFKDGKKVGRIPLGSLRQPNRARRLYSFAVLADTHYGLSETVNRSFSSAMEELGKSDVTCVILAGDVIDFGSVYDEKVWDNCAGIIEKCGKTVYAIPGNHDRYANFAEVPEYVKKFFIGDKTYGTVNIGNDVFILLGCGSYHPAEDNLPDVQVYAKEDLEEIFEIFKLNKEKRCFVVQHIDMTAALVGYDLNSIQIGYYLPYELLGRYGNVVEFHGHTHENAEFSAALGFRSLNVPPLRYCNEGFIVDVYKEGIHVRGLNFETGFIPIASYWVDTSTKDASEIYAYKEEK